MMAGASGVPIRRMSWAGVIWSELGHGGILWQRVRDATLGPKPHGVFADPMRQW